MLQAFHFLRPEWLLAIPIIGIALLFFLQRSKQDSGWEKVCDPALLHYQLAQQDDHSTPARIIHWLIPLVLLLCIIALAGPSWEKKEQPIFQQGNALVIILDLSLSMNARDIKPSRLERARLKIIDILKQKKEGQTGLIAFAGDAHTVSPLTIDNKTIISLLPALETSIMPLSGSHITDALDTAHQLLKNSGFAKGDILLMTDGIDQSEQKKLRQMVKNLYNQGYRFSVIGIGSQAGSPIPLPNQSGFVKDSSGQVILSKLTRKPLQELSNAGGGYYHNLSLDDSDFNPLLDRRLLNNDSILEQDNQLEQWVDAGGYLTVLLIPLALLAFRKGLLSILVVTALIPMLLAEPASASNADKLKEQWSDLWFSPDQQGQKAFNDNDYGNAAEKFNDSQWKAGAHYRAGNFEQAAEYYTRANDATGLYNKGNSLANLQKFQEAIAAYNEALKLNPDLKDAQSNRDYLQQLLEQQQQQSQQNSEQQNSEQTKSSDSPQQSQEQSSQTEESDKSEQSSQGENSSEDNASQQDDQQQKAESDTDSEGTDTNKNSSPPQEKQYSNDNPQADSEPKSPESYEPQSQQEQNQDESEQPRQAQSEAQEIQQNQEMQQNNKPRDAADASASASDVMSQLSQEEQQSLKQWLQRIPDNPGELLRIKFRNNTLLKQRQNQDSEQYEGKPW